MCALPSSPEHEPDFPVDEEDTGNPIVGVLWALIFTAIAVGFVALVWELVERLF